VIRFNNLKPLSIPDGSHRAVYPLRMRQAFKKAFQDIKDVVDGKDETVSMFYVLSFVDFFLS